jgi:hypothetical protein
MWEYAKAARAFQPTAHGEPDGWRTWLENHQWSGCRFDRRGEAAPICPECGNWESNGHAKDCRIAAMLSAAPQPARKPMTDEEANKLMKWLKDSRLPGSCGWIDVIRAAERFHQIKE